MEKKGRNSTADLLCIQCHVMYMTLDAPKISCQIHPFFQASWKTMSKVLTLHRFQLSIQVNLNSIWINVTKDVWINSPIKRASIYDVRSEWGGGWSPKSRGKKQNQLICDSDKGRGERGGWFKKPEIFADVIYGSPLRGHPYMTSALRGEGG